MNDVRVEEIRSSVYKPNNQIAGNEELLQELSKMQSSLISVGYGLDVDALENLRIWDLEKYLEEKNIEKNHIADFELGKFEGGCKEFCTTYKGIVSGLKGEEKASRALDKVKIEIVTIRNLELEYDDIRTEVDALAITKEGIIIVEVKNTSKNIFIDDEGNYFRTGTYLRMDCELGAKLQLREKYIRRALENTGYEDIPIKKLVVFTNNTIEVQNKCKEFSTCFVSQLSELVNDFGSGWTYKSSDLISIRELLIAAKAEPIKGYFEKFDIEEFRNDFAVLMAKLEEEPINEEAVNKKQEDESNTLNNIVDNIYPTAKYMFTALAAIAGTITVTNYISRRK